MKKFGFTMAELLVTLTIVGVVAAITAPLIDNLMPDKSKSKVLKAYKVISDVNEELLSDPSLYAYDNQCEGLGCTAAPSNPKYTNNTTLAAHNSGLAKYGMLFFDKLDLSPTWTENSAMVRSKDGIGWTVIPIPIGNPSKLRHILIYVYFNEEGEATCMYGANGGCTKPNTHLFIVNLDGRVEGLDRLTRAYLLNPTKLNDKKNDYAKAASLQPEGSWFY